MPSPLVSSLIAELNATKEFFDRGTRALEEGDSSYSPQASMMTAAQQIAHVAQTLDWFVEGATRPEGFDLNFDEHAKAVAKITSIKAAREWHDRSHKNVVATIEKMSDAELHSPLPPGPVMGGYPKVAIVGSIVDHTAHHRGALSVYTRLIGKIPPMPYMDM